MISRSRVEEILKDSGVLLQGHFILTSGRHSDKYMQCAQILQYPKYVDEIVGSLAAEFADDKVDVVIGPATGGIILAYEFARKLSARNLFAERVDNKMTLRRGFTFEPGTRILVAEDVVTTGGSVQEVIDIVKGMGGVLVGVAVLVDRSNGKTDFGTKFRAAYTDEIVSYEAENCPLCKSGAAPAIKPGSRGVK